MKIQLTEQDYEILVEKAEKYEAIVQIYEAYEGDGHNDLLLLEDQLIKIIYN